MFARYAARRYLFSPKSRSVINLIAGLSVVAVAMPVAAMIILLSVFNGFETLVRSMGSAFDADLTVEPVRGQTFPAAELDTAAIARTGGVEALSFVLEQGALLERRGRQATAVVRGVDDHYAEVIPVDQTIATGEYRVRLGDLDRLVAGRALAHQLGIRSLADAEVSLYGLRRGHFSSLLPMESYTKRTVGTSGIYTLDLQTEQRFVLTSLRLAQELFSYPERASALLVRIAADANPDAVKEAAAQAAGSRFRVETRAERNASFYAIMNYEKWGIFFISLLVLVIASFSIIGALAMLITDKRDDIRTLRSLGAGTPLIRSLFRWEGWYVGGLGAAAGVVLGVGLSLLQQHFGLIEIPADSFLTKSYPVEFRWGDLAAVLAAFAAVTAAVTGLTAHGMIKNEKEPI